MRLIRHERNVLYPLGEVFKDQNKYLFSVANHLDNFMALNCAIKIELCHKIKIPKPEKSELHYHPFFEFDYVTKGKVQQECDAKKVLINEGHIFCMSPGSYHQWDAIGQDIEMIGFMLSIIPNNNKGLQHLELLKSAIKKNRYCIKASSKLKSFSKQLFSYSNKINEAMSLELGSHAMHGFLLELLRSLIGEVKVSALEKDEQTKSVNALFLQAKSLVHLSLGDNISLEDVSRNLSVSKQHLNRLFKKNEGMTLGEYILQQKLGKAKALLETSPTLNINQIASLAGFQDPNYFSQFFKKRTGQRPQEFRNSH